VTAWIAAAGWVGAGLVLAAYALISARRLDGTSPVFQLFNLVGSAGLAASSAAAGALPSAAVNVIWMAIGVVVLIRRRDPRADPAAG
jgi:hypothetical protein